MERIDTRRLIGRDFTILRVIGHGEERVECIIEIESMTPCIFRQYAWNVYSDLIFDISELRFRNLLPVRVKLLRENGTYLFLHYSVDEKAWKPIFRQTHLDQLEGKTFYIWGWKVKNMHEHFFHNYKGSDEPLQKVKNFKRNFHDYKGSYYPTARVLVQPADPPFAHIPIQEGKCAYVADRQLLETDSEAFLSFLGSMASAELPILVTYKGQSVMGENESIIPERKVI